MRKTIQDVADAIVEGVSPPREWAEPLADLLSCALAVDRGFLVLWIKEEQRFAQVNRVDKAWFELHMQVVARMEAFVKDIEAIYAQQTFLDSIEPTNKVQ